MVYCECGQAKRPGRVACDSCASLEHETYTRGKATPAILTLLQRYGPSTVPTIAKLLGRESHRDSQGYATTSMQLLRMYKKGLVRVIEVKRSAGQPKVYAAL